MVGAVAVGVSDGAGPRCRSSVPKPGTVDRAMAELAALAAIGWAGGRRPTEGVSLALAAAACSGRSGRPVAGARGAGIYEEMRPYAGTAVVLGPPPRPASARPTSTWGCSPRRWETSRWRRSTSKLRCGSPSGCRASLST